MNSPNYGDVLFGIFGTVFVGTVCLGLLLGCVLMITEVARYIKSGK